MFYSDAYAIDIQSSAQGEILLDQYQEKQKELEQFTELHKTLQTPTKSAELIDQALFQLLTTKISMVETELTQMKEQFWDIPLTDLLALKIPPVEYSLDKVDMNRVKDAWLSWVNDLRTKKGLTPYKYHPLLDYTAQDVAIYLGALYPSGRVWNMATHEKPGQPTPWYSHSYITKWFKEHGVYTVNVGGSNHTENTWYSNYRCDDTEDCTDEMIAALRRTFNYYMSEERFVNYAPRKALHYLSMINPNFEYIGLGLAVGEWSSRRWSVIHYMTELQALDTETLKQQWYAQYLPL